MEAVAVTCCELGMELFDRRGRDREIVTICWDDFEALADKLRTKRAEISRLEDFLAEHDLWDKFLALQGCKRRFRRGEAMKLTPAEYKLLDELNSLEGGKMLANDLNKRMMVIAAWMAGSKGLLRAREWDKGYVVATALGKRSHARGMEK